MPDRQLAVFTYTTASIIAAAGLAYVFGPSLFPDHEAVASKKGWAVGLSNPANDCFINAVLQALAGSGELQSWLKAEIDIAESVSEKANGENAADVLQAYGPEAQDYMASKLVTEALDRMLVSLSQESAYRRTISAVQFVQSLEAAFQSRLNRRQQDAQELLQLVLDRLRDEYRARSPQDVVRKPSRKSSKFNTAGTPFATIRMSSSNEQRRNCTNFPFKGMLESHLECLTCHYTPKPSLSSFVTLTLSVPQQGSTTLDECFDTLLKQETIEDYKCDMCRITDAKYMKMQELRRAPAVQKQNVERDIQTLEDSIENGPETLPDTVVMPPSERTPKRRIKKNLRIALYPRVLVVHLSRSIFGASHWSSKNTAAISFQEYLMLGGFDRQRYKLASVVTHLGRHDSGHYETYRRLQVSASGATGNQTGAELSKRTTKPQQAFSNSSRDQSRTLGLTPRGSAKKQSRIGKWWRISDEKVSECRTADVLALRSQVYLLIFEKAD